MSYTIAVATIGAAIGALLTVAVIGLRDRRRYNTGWHDGHACGLRDNIVSEDDMERVAAAVAGPFHPRHEIWIDPQHHAGDTDDQH